MYQKALFSILLCVCACAPVIDVHLSVKTLWTSPPGPLITIWCWTIMSGWWFLKWAVMLLCHKTRCFKYGYDQRMNHPSNLAHSWRIKVSRLYVKSFQHQPQQFQLQFSPYHYYFLKKHFAMTTEHHFLVFLSPKCRGAWAQWKIFKPPKQGT